MIGFFREHQNLAAFIIMAAVAVLFFHPLLARISTHILTDGAFIPDGFSDAYNFLWSYWWFQKAFASGKNLFLCDWIYPPDGENLLFHTHIFLPSILSIPISRVIGTIPAFNLTILTMLVLAAFSYYLFVRNTFGTSFYAAVVAGLMFGFSPYFLFKAHSHLNLVGACFWGSCLGILIHAYVRNAFSIRAAIACSLFFWATF